MNDKPDLEQRVVRLEESLMHNEHLLARLNNVICGVQDRLDEQSRQLRTLKNTLEQLKHQDPEERSFEDERPPHY